jgi:N-acylneuraminate cytidylyltransferase
MDAVGFIFARGGSKGIPKKNTRIFFGKPLIAWSIDHAKKVKRLRRIIVSTDSDEIAKIALANGAEVPFMRPVDLALDDTPEWFAWQHAIQMVEGEEGRLPDVIVSLPTTAPLRDPLDVENCLDEFSKGGAEALITLYEAYRNHWYKMVKANPEGTVMALDS